MRDGEEQNNSYDAEGEGSDGSQACEEGRAFGSMDREGLSTRRGHDDRHRADVLETLVRIVWFVQLRRNAARADAEAAEDVTHAKFVSLQERVLAHQRVLAV